MDDHNEDEGGQKGRALKEAMDFKAFDATDSMLGDGNLDDEEASEDSADDMAIDEFAPEEQPPEEEPEQEEASGEEDVADAAPKGNDEDAVGGEDGEGGDEEIDWSRIGDGLNNANFSTLLPGAHKVKLLSENPQYQFGQHNDGTYKCWRCHRSFTGPILMCPKPPLHKTKKVYCYGIFDSWACVLAFSNEDRIGVRQKEQRTMLILKLAGKKIIPAPSVLLTKAYGGKLTDEEFEGMVGKLNTRVVLPTEFAEYTFVHQAPLLVYATESEDVDELLNIAIKQLDTLPTPQGFNNIPIAVNPPDDALVPVQITAAPASAPSTRKSARGGRGARATRSKRALPTASLLASADVTGDDGQNNNSDVIRDQ